jgi:hypothetical protein
MPTLRSAIQICRVLTLVRKLPSAGRTGESPDLDCCADRQLPPVAALRGTSSRTRQTCSWRPLRNREGTSGVSDTREAAARFKVPNISRRAADGRRSQGSALRCGTADHLVQASDHRACGHNCGTDPQGRRLQRRRGTGRRRASNGAAEKNDELKHSTLAGEHVHF